MATSQLRLPRCFKLTLLFCCILGLFLLIQHPLKHGGEKRKMTSQIRHPKFVSATERENFKERLRFGELIANWPSEKPKATIYFLAEVGRLTLLRRALKRLDHNFNAVYKYPVIIFHESNFDAESRAKIQNSTGSRLFFQQVEFPLPKFINQSLVPKYDKCTNRPVGYRHMCRFNALLVYKEPIFDHLQFYWRLDTDSEILRPIRYDVFKRMHDLDKVHGYIWKTFDMTSCVIGLWNVTRRYAMDNNIRGEFFHKWPNGKVFYNNFEISRVDFWRSPKVQRYLDHIDRLGGIYYMRWGDNPIKALAVALFLPQERLHYFKDIGYRHFKILVRH